MLNVKLQNYIYLSNKLGVHCCHKEGIVMQRTTKMTTQYNTDKCTHTHTHTHKILLPLPQWSCPVEHFISSAGLSVYKRRQHFSTHVNTHVQNNNR